MVDDDEHDDVVDATMDGRSVERQADGPSEYPQWVRRLGRRFGLFRREVFSRSGERTHSRITYTAEEEAHPHAPAGQQLGGRGGPKDQPVVTGGDGYQTEPPTARD
jgi:hypothetical protein